MNCWQNEPEARPSFNDLTQQLKGMENQHKVRLNSKLFKKAKNAFFILHRRKPVPLVVLHQAGKSFIYNFIRRFLKLFKVPLTWNTAKL